MPINDDGSVDDEGELIGALQGRILALERVVLALLLDLVGRQAEADSSYAEAAQRVRKIILSSAQHTELQSNPSTDVIWESCGMALRVLLDNLVAKAEVLDGR